MAKRKRRAFTNEFKAEAVRLVRESGKSVPTVARELDLTETALRSWVRQAEVDAGRGTSGALTTEEREELGLAARRRRRFRVTTQSRHPFPIAPNVLARQFQRPGPDQAWVTDITYIPTGEGWLYLAVILDLCSRFAVGWAMNDRITDDLTLDALGMALGRRRPPRGLLHHSDRGSQYASGD